jgi:hypothetical protein
MAWHGYPQQIGPIGVEVRDSRNTTIRGNLIAGLRTVGTNHYNGQIFGWAVLVGATNRDSNGTVVEGNTIGLAADGVTPIVTRSGVTVSPLSGNYHAFGTRISANHIARVETTGVVIGSQENGITITGNSIHDSALWGSICLLVTSRASVVSLRMTRATSMWAATACKTTRASVSRDDRFDGHSPGNARFFAD